MKVLTAVAVIAAASLFAQRSAVAQNDHAPTVEQCRADYNLWQSQMSDYMHAEAARLNSGTADRTDIMRLTMDQIKTRARGMFQCQAVDSARSNNYQELVGALLAAHRERYVLFVQRHKLEDQLFEEDEAGKR